ncbi:MAG: hypothetical protein HQ512_07315 [Rhodospirillales bacterium]|nr:hypothetical protein [Rhodospirillales bacterium]
MSGTSLHPRDDQIIELTRGLQLPLAPLNDIHLRFIAEMLARAWGDLLSTQLPTLKTGSEPEINTLMKAKLNTLIDGDTLLSSLVRVVSPGEEAVSFDASHLEKQPDLSIHLTDRNRNFPLVVECKLIEHSTGKPTNLYCNKGLVRFVVGEYAWATCEAFMLAYVRDGSSIKSSLTPLLKKNQENKPDIYRTQTLPESVSHSTLDLAISSHGRNFNYQPPNDKPGPISLWHLWMPT